MAILTSSSIPSVTAARKLWSSDSMSSPKNCRSCFVPVARCCAIRRNASSRAAWVSSGHYWASPLEADLSAGNDVALVGGGNSAGQATVFLATRARRVTLIARRPLEQTMSQYLIERIRAQPNIEVVIGCEISELEGAGGVLRGVSWRDRSSGTVTERPV